MKCVETAGQDELARVFVLQLRQEPRSRVECVGAIDPAVPRDDKIVLVVSSQFGCPVGCAMCDAGSWYAGNLSADELLTQVRFLIGAWAGEHAARTCPKCKVQFARMGEPSLNPAVLEALERLPQVVSSPGLIACLATTAPSAASGWFERLLEVRDRSYAPGQLQLQFSAQSTDEQVRDRLIPVAKWTLRQVGQYACRFVRDGDRKVVLNFALAHGIPITGAALAEAVSPAHCMVKLTPLNETRQSREHGLTTAFVSAHEAWVQDRVRELESYGFQCVVSVGDPRESALGTSCGQLARLGRGDALRLGASLS